jgi:hypothetical protein
MRPPMLNTRRVDSCRQRSSARCRYAVFSLCHFLDVDGGNTRAEVCEGRLVWPRDRFAPQVRIRAVARNLDQGNSRFSRQGSLIVSRARDTISSRQCSCSRWAEPSFSRATALAGMTTAHRYAGTFLTSPQLSHWRALARGMKLAIGWEVNRDIYT